MSTTPDSFHRTDDFESRIDSVLLPNEAWAVFAHLEKPVTVAEIARRLECDPAAVQTQIDLLLQHKLARKHLMNWRDFLAQKGISTGPTRMSPAGPQPPPVALADKARRPAPPASVPAARPAAPVRVAPTEVPAQPVASEQKPTVTIPAAPVRRRMPEPELADPEGTISFSMANETARRSRRASIAMSITFRLGRSAPTPPARIAPAATLPPVSAATIAEPEVADAPSFSAPAVPETAATASTLVRPRKLRPLIDAITRKGGGGLNGQLLVYRVFLRVPPALMFNAGIKSLSLVDDSLELQDGQIYDVIRAAAQSVASIDLDAVTA